MLSERSVTHTGPVNGRIDSNCIIFGRSPANCALHQSWFCAIKRIAKAENAIAFSRNNNE